MFSDEQKIGVFLIFLSFFFSFLGVLLFFDTGLLSIGNLCLIPGVSMLWGFERTQSFLFQKTKLKGVICFFGGLFLVLIGRSIIGFLLEGFGFINLFGDFFPLAFSFIGGFLRLVFGSPFSRSES